MSRRGYVYLIRPVGHNVYKVGCSTDPDRRLAAIQCKTKGLVLELVAKVLYDDYERAEFSWHLKLDAYRLPGGREWFALPQGEVDLFIAMARQQSAAWREEVQ